MALALLAAAVATSLPAPAAAAAVCRPDTLGNVGCSGSEPRPLARPSYRPPPQALDRVREKIPTEDDDGFIPAYRTRRLGDTIIDPGTGPGLCRPDALGNLHCR